ncbi:hypothetical protein IHQ68_04795 [Chelatococcus sambhunathii]|uniref:Uncharacterized protein n=1 Tax=Chelatococcus sambhunathii TaxID=363953 RepID=A0ABU1DCZ5_9HYPH|nr:hypothetical protein [Chelatococcus sambhunathii]MDR4305942.1 hypothetical protein [Chelatococcus sambhunathii]
MPRRTVRDAIVIELPNFRGAGIRLLFGLIGVAHAVAASIGTQSTTVEVSKWLSVVLGQGGPSTEEADRRILAFARSRVPTVASDDEADAIGIAEWALQRLVLKTFRGGRSALMQCKAA